MTAEEILKREATEACLTHTQKQLVLAAMREVAERSFSYAYALGVNSGAKAEMEQNYNNIGCATKSDVFMKQLFPEKL